MWKFIFNGHFKLLNAQDTLSMARAAGYKMFSHNGDIYRVPDDPEAKWDSEPLKITEDDLS